MRGGGKIEGELGEWRESYRKREWEGGERRDRQTEREHGIHDRSERERERESKRRSCDVQNQETDRQR